MDLLRRNKFHYLSIFVIFVLFLFSVQLRKEKLNLELSPGQEWITAHVLMTLEIWEDGGGPQNYHFSPIYSYHGEGNKRISSLGGVVHPSGEMYYTSYPPFAFIGAYYFTKILGGPDVASLRAFGLIIHFFCSLLIYLIIRKFRSSEKDTMSVSGILGAALYLFSAGTLWMHGIMYFSDMLVQLFIILAVYFLVRHVKSDYTNENRFVGLFGFVVFLGVYTEWLALFFAFYAGLFLLVLYFVQKKKSHLKAFVVIGVSAALSLGLTIAQYSSLDGFDSLVEVSQAKYDYRSGNFEVPEDGQGYNWDNPESFELLETNVNRNWPMVLNMLPILLIMLVPALIWRKSRENMKEVKWKAFIPLVLLISILTHYLLFYNFNAIHNFSNLKTGFFMILVTAIISSVIEESLNWKINIGLAAILAFLVISKVPRDFNRFDNFYHAEEFPLERHLSADLVREYQHPDYVDFSDLFITPEYMYRAKTNVSQVNDHEQVRSFMVYLEQDTCYYYHHDFQTPIYVEMFAMEGDSLRLYNRIDF